MLKAWCFFTGSNGVDPLWQYGHVLDPKFPEIAEGFMHIETSQEHWNEINERFGQTNGHLIYQLKCEFMNIEQDNFSVAAYYTWMKHIWDKLQSIDPMPQSSYGALKSCKCDMLKKIQELEARNHLMQILII